MIADYISYAIKNLLRQQVRTYLTLIGIIVSVAALVTLISLGNGLKGAITEQFEQLGSNKVFVYMDGGDPMSTVGLTIKDGDFVSKYPYFDNVATFAFEPNVKVTYKKKDVRASITAWNPEDQYYFIESSGMKPDKGRFFSKGDTYDVILGSLAASNYFNATIHVKNTIYINDVKFRVVGIMERIGNEQDDNSIAIPLDTFHELIKPDKISGIQGTVKNGLDLKKISKTIEKDLEDYRGKKDILVLTPEQILEFLNNVLGGMTIILSAIAFISLIVGAIGIMNSMYTNVLERTKEIGIMKSVGAKQKDILFFFLFESGAIGAVGGLIGVIVGTTLAFGMGGLITAANFLPINVTIDPLVVLGSILFATIIGVVSGFLPSYRASKMTPVEALRYD